jgi:hypothetical protein
MYINVTPQGDARVRAPPADAADASILRYYALNGSSIPCYELQPATFASMRAVGGESVRVMSASDKLMRWTQLGMQVGAFVGFKNSDFYHFFSAGCITFALYRPRSFGNARDRHTV